MADNFTVVTQYPGIDVIGGNQTRDVVFVGITTIPHGTYIEFPVDSSVYTAGVVEAGATSWADIIENVWSIPYVAGVQWVQVVNASNQLVNSLTITVASTSNQSTASFTVPIDLLGPDEHAAVIAAKHKQLDAAEAL